MNVDWCQVAADPRPSQTTGCESTCTGCQSLHHRHLLLLLSPKANTHFTVPWKVDGWVDLVDVLPVNRWSPILVLTGSDIAQLHWSGYYIDWGQRVTTKPNRQTVCCPFTWSRLIFTVMVFYSLSPLPGAFKNILTVCHCSSHSRSTLFAIL